MSEHLDELQRRAEMLPQPPSPVPWFMDIDGVLNAIGKKPLGGWGDYERIAVHTSNGFAFPICYSPRLVLLLNTMCARRLIDVRWLTTWEEDAFRRFGPAVGLSLGRNALSDLGVLDQWWKLKVIKDHLQATSEHDLFIWTDDEIRDDLPARQATDFLPVDRAVVISPDPDHGLRPSDLARILDAIAAVSQE